MGLNHSLHYLPWTQFLVDIGNTNRRFIKSSCLAKAESVANSVRLEPGMKLRIEDASVYTMTKNVSLPGISVYEWTVPTGRLRPEDYFLIATLLAGGEPEAGDQPVDLVLKFRELVAKVAANGPAESLAARLSEVVSKDLLFEVFNTREGTMSGTPGSATRIREWLTEPTAADFKAIAYPSSAPQKQFLRITLPMLNAAGATTKVRIKGFHSAGTYFLDGEPPDFVKVRQKNKWYAATATAARKSRLDVLVPVRVQIGTSTQDWRYVPVYYSIGDVEKEFGFKFKAVRRKLEYVGCIVSRDLVEIDPARLESGSDGRAVINFVGLIPPEGGLDSIVLDSLSLKEYLLVAPFDILTANP